MAAIHVAGVCVDPCGAVRWTAVQGTEPRLRVFESRVLRRVFGPKRDEVTRDWRKLRNEELNDMYS